MLIKFRLFCFSKILRVFFPLQVIFFIIHILHEAESWSGWGIESINATLVCYSSINQKIIKTFDGAKNWYLKVEIWKATSLWIMISIPTTGGPFGNDLIRDTLQCYIATWTIEMLSCFELLRNSFDKKKKRPRMTKSTISPRHHIRFPHFTIFFCSILLQSRIINNSLFYILHISTRLVKSETEDGKKRSEKTRWWD